MKNKFTSEGSGKMPEVGKTRNLSPQIDNLTESYITILEPWNLLKPGNF